jgi:V/A-type H+/Na+-transporting ATPase subunit G/H
MFATVRHIEARRQGQSAPPRAEIRTRVPDREVAATQNVRFSTAIRGYDRDEVHRYMRKMNTLLAELQITAAPEAAIKAALEQARDERRSVIAQAEQEAEEIIRRSRSQAGDRLEEAKQEAERLREAAAEEAHGSQAAAETRIRRLQAEVQQMMEERDRVVEELVELSRRLDELLEQNGRNGRESPAPVKAAGG